MKLTFLGAAGTVTGSRFLVDYEGGRVLVDCGLFQGVKAVRGLNWAPFPVLPQSIDAVVLTHAHIDHSGYLPGLVRDGFSGHIWCTGATEDLCRLLLPDAAHLQEEDARFANRKRSSRHDPALPLFTGEDAQQALGQLRTCTFGSDFTAAANLTARFSPVGHILGAACVRLQDASGTSVLFTGDVGRPSDPIMRPPAPRPTADHIVTESTYGDRVHSAMDPMDEIAAVATRTIARGGSLLIPTFAVGRAQMLLHLLSSLRRQDRIPPVPIYLNSPMAVSATELFLSHPDGHRLSAAECVRMGEDVRLVRTVEESKQLTARTDPSIILSASGMATGGRILHHLRQLAPGAENTILFVGYQAQGTRGRLLQCGADEIRIFGTEVPVHAEIATISGVSAHADAKELTAWLGAGAAPRSVYVVHGEPGAADALRRRLRSHLGWHAQVGRMNQTVDLR